MEISCVVLGTKGWIKVETISNVALLDELFSDMVRKIGGCSLEL